jgi:hypothetical protein
MGVRQICHQQCNSAEVVMEITCKMSLSGAHGYGQFYIEV